MASTGIIVLGMHRSGTSLVTALLAELGCWPGRDLVPADPSNPQGYWEHRDVVAAHEAFLHAIGRSWSDPRPIPPSRFQGEAAAEARATLAEILRHDLLARPPWLVKDPRLCRLLPLWKGPLEETDGGASVVFVHVLRSPAAVALSLAARDGMSPTKSDALWLRHYLDAERATRGRPRRWLALERLASRGADELAPLIADLPFSDPPDRSAVAAALASRLEPALLHHNPSGDALTSGHHEWTVAAHQLLERLADDDEDSGRTALDRLSLEVERAEALVYDEEWGWEEGVRQERELRLRREVEAQTRQVEALRAEQQVLRDQIASLAEGSTGLDPVLARLESTLGVGGEATLEVGRRVGALESSLAALSDADADLPRRLDEVVERLERLDAMVRHDLLGRQATLLERSLAVSATLESEWSRFRERALEAESARVAAEHARRRCEAERDEALASAARALGEREAAVRNRVVAVAAFEDVQRELARCREQVATTRGAARAAIAERDRIAEEKDRTSQALLSVTSSRSWKLTRPLRALGRAFRQALAWTAE
jgi:hypothetical protein